MGAAYTLLILHALIRLIDSVYFHEYKLSLINQNKYYHEWMITSFVHVLHSILLVIGAIFSFAGIYIWLMALFILLEVFFLVWHFLKLPQRYRIDLYESILHCFALIIATLFWVNWISELTMLMKTESKITWIFDYSWSHGFGMILGVISLIIAVKQLSRLYLMAKLKKENSAQILIPITEKLSKCQTILFIGLYNFFHRELVKSFIEQGHNVLILLSDIDDELICEFQGKITFLSHVDCLREDEFIDVIYHGVLSFSDLSPSQKKIIENSLLPFEVEESFTHIDQILRTLSREPEVIIQESCLFNRRDILQGQKENDASMISSKYGQMIEERSQLNSNARKLLLNYGHILSNLGGYFVKERLSFDFGVSVQWGNEKEWVNWIHYIDAIRVVHYLIGDPYIEGTLIASSPNPIRYDEYICGMEDGFRAIISLKVPELFYGSKFLSDRSQVYHPDSYYPTALTEHEFQFLYPDFSDVLQDLTTSEVKSPQLNSRSSL